MFKKNSSTLLATLAAAFIGMLLSPLAANATLTIGGYAFDDDAFADTLISSSGNYTISGSSLTDVLTDIDETTYAFSFSPNAYVQLGFTDNYLVNGTSNDLAIFELGVADSFRVSLTLGGTTVAKSSASTGFSAAGFNLNVALFDLNDFGLSSGAQVSDVFIGLDIQSSSATVPSLSLVGALNSAPRTSVPEPASLALLGLGLAGLGFTRRRRRV